jgi:hypothetical protein
VSNAVLRVLPDGRVETVLRDADPAHLDWVEAAFLAGGMGRPHLDRAAGRRLANVSNLAFGGPGRRRPARRPHRRHRQGRQPRHAA